MYSIQTSYTLKNKVSSLERCRITGVTPTDALEALNPCLLNLYKVLSEPRQWGEAGCQVRRDHPATAAVVRRPSPAKLDPTYIVSILFPFWALRDPQLQPETLAIYFCGLVGK